MQKFGFLLAAALLALCLGGCAAEDADYTEYNGVKIPNKDIAVSRNLHMNMKDEVPYTPTDEELLASLARRQVQLDEADRLGLMPSKAAAAAAHQEQLVKRVMRALASDDPMSHEEGLFFLTMWQKQQELLGLHNHDEYCDYIISTRQMDMGINALREYFASQPEALSQRGFRPGEPWVDTYGEYVDNLLAQAAQGAAVN